MPKERGATSNNKRLFNFSSSSPLKIAACTVAPNATASSGFIFFDGSLPLNKSFSRLCIFGIRVLPPTKTISST